MSKTGEKRQGDPGADPGAELRRRLEAALGPCRLEVLDEGHLHLGHAAAGRGHYRVRIVAEAFRGLPPLERHRRVYAAAGDLLPGRIHALAVEARSPEEA